MNYPLIEKWLGIEVYNLHAYEGFFFVSADKLEAKLAEGFQVYRDQLNYLSLDKDWQVALAIGKQQIKKKTREKAALELLKEMVHEEWGTDYADGFTVKAKEILEME